MSGAATRNGHRGTILVTDAGRSSAIAVIRSLGRRGYRVVAADSDPRAAGFRSRYAAAHENYPSPGAGAAGCAESIARIVRQHQPDLVIPATDEMVHILAGARDRLKPHCRLAIAEDEVLRTVMDKGATLRLAQELGVPIPATRPVRTVSEARDAAAELRYPLVLKSAVTPCVDEGGAVLRRPVRYAAGPDALMTELAAYRGGPVLLQEFCRGQGCGVEMLAHRGRPIAAFQHRRLAEVPTSGGASAWRESMALDPDLFGHACRLVEALRWNGLIMVEFKVGAVTTLMEINGRVWGSMPLAIAAGMDFPARLADLFLGAEPPLQVALACDYRSGVKACNLTLTLLWIANVLAGRRRYPFLPHPQRREALRALVWMLGVRGRFDMLSRDDMGPGLAELGRLPRKLLRKVTAALRHGGSDNGQDHAGG